MLDELVFGEAPVEIVIKEEPIFDYPMASMPIVNDLAAEIKTETETLSSREEQMRKRLTQRKCQQIVLKVTRCGLMVTGFDSRSCQSFILNTVSRKIWKKSSISTETL